MITRDKIKGLMVQMIGMLFLQLPAWFGKVGLVILFISTMAWTGIGMWAVLSGIANRIALGKGWKENGLFKR